jgi:hypothetical protein
MLAQPVRYFPLEKGVYAVAPGLSTLGTPFGNGEADAKLLQFDSAFAEYRANRVRCRSERLSKYCLTDRLAPEVARAAARLLLDRLVVEHPLHFLLSIARPLSTLECRLTGETLVFDEALQLVEARSPSALAPPYVSAWDALCSQLQEDVAIVVAPPGQTDWLAALHLCSPSHWAGEDKIGRAFTTIHRPIPGIEKINRAAASFVDAMINKGPYVRFVWGFGTDQRLNHHPSPPPGIAPEEWRGRKFKLNDPTSKLSLRVERQCTIGLPEVHAAIFTIRTYFIEGEMIRRDPRERELLRSALLSMTPESLAYKGLTESLADLLEWLDGA